MPRDGSGIYTKPYPNVVSGTTIESTVHNGTVSDIETDLNAPRPIISGGTGASNADQALVNMSGEKAAQLVTNYDSQLWMPGSFRSAAAATGAPNATSSFVGTAYINEALANPPTNANVVIEARDQNDTTVPGRTYVREKKAGTWGAWTGGIYAAPFDALAYNGMQVNGGMQVSQELGANDIYVTNTGKYILDGNWVVSSSGAQTMLNRCNPGGPLGFSHHLSAGCTVVNTSPAATDHATIDTRIEGYRIIPLAWGTAAARPITMAFWISAGVPGMYSGSVVNGTTANRSYPFTFTVSASNTWEYKTVTIPGDTIGTWASDNTKAMQIYFAAMAGSSLTAPAGAWVAGNFRGANGTANNVASLYSTFNITGVTILPGTQAPTAAQSPNIMRPYDQELVTGQRYYEKSYRYPGLVGTADPYGSIQFDYGATAANVGGTVRFSVIKRVRPTMSFWDDQGNIGKCTNGTGANQTMVHHDPYLGEGSFFVYASLANPYFRFHWVADARL